MNVIVFDPYTHKEIVEKMGAKYIEHLDEFWGQCDFITIHTPKTKETTGLINVNTLNRMKKGVRIINCARGGIIDEKALADAITSGQVAGAAIDVYEDEKHVDKSPLIALGNKIVLTPHLGASTDEAQINVAVDVANQVASVLKGGNATSAINIPALKPQKLEAVKDYMGLAQNIAEFASQLIEGSIKEINISVSGKLVELDCSPLEIAILKGVIGAKLEDVNYVNAPIIAKQRGIEVKTSKINNNTDEIEVTITTSQKTAVIKGALLAKDVKRIVQINNYTTSIEPKAHMLLVPHINKPNMIALVAGVLGADNVNISGMQVAQSVDNPELSVMIINCDSEVSEETLDKINKVDGVNKAKYIGLEI